jgi:hypothetical protein
MKSETVREALDPLHYGHPEYKDLARRVKLIATIAERPRSLVMLRVASPPIPAIRGAIMLTTTSATASGDICSGIRDTRSKISMVMGISAIAKSEIATISPTA